ncbi:MAG: glycosyltransferase family 9 protein [Acidobacteria bacterium]|nr:glycosyltransferase family 9 protein [Acidobacteriota bacterium]MCA1618594.1 glycosyltransferase family 9 protein [Acidobacteriota bacterium]
MLRQPISMESQFDPLLTSVKRCHGLGNVIMLLPVLDAMAAAGRRVHLATRCEWVGALRALRPEFDIDDEGRLGTVDLDAATASLRPDSPRGEEFAELLGVAGPLGPPRLRVPECWGRPFRRWAGAVGFAPEAGHPSREWPAGHSHMLAERLKGAPLLLLGTSAATPLPCDLDTRGRLKLEELLGLLSVLRQLVCMDSGMLHLAAAVGVPTVCVFGGITPGFRIHPWQRVLALQAELGCCPCDKRETCDGRYDCIKAVTPRAVLDALDDCLNSTSRIVRRVPAQTPAETALP